MTPALLIIDLQTALCQGQYAMHGIEALLERVNSLAARARAARAPVVFIQHEASGSPLEHGSAAWQIDARLHRASSDWVVAKRFGNAFHHTDLAQRLRAAGVHHVVLCGAQSDFCVSNTALGALSAEFDVTLVADGHSTIGNGVLSPEQIIAHVNATIPNWDSYGRHILALPTDEVLFA